MTLPSPRGLFVTDLDGTLLAASGEIPAANLEALHAAGDAGVVVALVTGRRRSTVRREYPKLDGLRFRVATSNGAVVLAPDNERPERVFALDWGLVTALDAVREVASLTLLCITAPRDGEPEGPDVFVRQPGSRRWATSLTPYKPETLVEIETAPSDRDLVHAALRVEARDAAEALLPAIAAALPGSVTVHVVTSPVGGGALLEIVPRGGKSLALLHLAATLGITTDRTGAIGDEMNDLDLVQVAAHGFAVGGSVLAGRHPDVEEVGTAADGAVADAIERFLDRLE